MTEERAALLREKGLEKSVTEYRERIFWKAPTAQDWFFMTPKDYKYVTGQVRPGSEEPSDE